MSNESVQLIYPSDEMVKNATVSGMDAYQALCAEAEADYAGFWAKRAREFITWKQPFTQVARRVQRSVLQVVCRRQAERFLQLPRPSTSKPAWATRLP